MKRQRLTREEQKQLTQERLLEAAAEVFSKHGFERASVDEIAETAGYSKGAVYSNFEGKESLFLALLDRRLRQDQKALQHVVSQGASLGNALDSVSQVSIEQIAEEQRWMLLTLEFFLYSMRNEQVRYMLAKRYKALRETLASLLEDKLKDSDSPIAPKDVASLIIALGSGLAIQKHIDSDAIPDDLLNAAIEHLSTTTLP